jgi:hypothetical protein
MAVFAERRIHEEDTGIHAPPLNVNIIALI